MTRESTAAATQMNEKHLSQVNHVDELLLGRSTARRSETLFHLEQQLLVAFGVVLPLVQQLAVVVPVVVGPLVPSNS